MTDHDKPQRFELVLPRRTLLLVCAVVALVMLLAAWYYSRLPHMNRGLLAPVLLAHLGIAWLAACVAAGTFRRMRNRRPSPSASVWPLSIPVIVCGVAVGVLLYARLGAFASGLSPASASSLNKMVLILAILPPLYAVGGTACLHWASRYWKIQPDPAATCPVCRYDLRGGTAERCPECGTSIEHDAEIPRSFYGQRRFWFYPELAQLTTAGERYAAWKSALQEARKAKLENILFVVSAGAIAVLNTTLANSRIQPWVPIGCFLLIESALMFRWHRRIRRLLRAHINEQSTAKPGQAYGRSQEQAPGAPLSPPRSRAGT